MEKNLEDAVKIGILYFIHTVVFSQLDKANIPARDFRMVDDESYSRFPWGKLAFAKLMDSFSRSMNEVQQYYRLNDMPHALQIWWYECCSEVNESITVRENNLIPRMVNWKVVKPKSRYEDLMEDMFTCIQKFIPVTTGIEPT
ncbi:hypothetical protein FXO37_21897 [Capsicum annuum]|nr:hypothetical protein FXO37_21897 [Capsicum annuum]